jgi:hypothetical protein
MTCGLSDVDFAVLFCDFKGNYMMDVGYHGLWGLLILAGDIWAIINIFQSSASNEKKLIWIIVVLLLPLLGLILWYFIGPRGGSLSRQGK